jgi:hypothetical protein
MLSPNNAAAARKNEIKSKAKSQVGKHTAGSPFFAFAREPAFSASTSAHMRPLRIWRTHATSDPKFGRLPTAKARSGLSRARLYELAVQHKGLFRKDGASTIVDLERLDQILGDLPAAEISLPPSKVRRRGTAT